MTTSLSPGSNTRFFLDALNDLQVSGGSSEDLAILADRVAKARAVEDSDAPAAADADRENSAAFARNAPAAVRASLQQKFEAAQIREAGSDDPDVAFAQAVNARRQGMPAHVVAAFEARHAAIVDRIAANERAAKLSPVVRYQHFAEALKRPAVSPLLVQRLGEIFRETRQPVDATFLLRVIEDGTQKGKDVTDLTAQFHAVLDQEIRQVGQIRASSEIRKKILDLATQNRAPAPLIAAIRASLDRQIQIEGGIAGGLRPSPAPVPPPIASPPPPVFRPRAFSPPPSVLADAPGIPRAAMASGLLRDVVTFAVLTLPAWATLLLIRKR